MAKSLSQPLALLSASALADKRQLAAFEANVKAQLNLIDQTETDNVKRRVFVGLALHCIKASLGHGRFGPWLKQHVKSAAHRNCNYMMRAALVFISETGIETPEIKALPGGDFSLAMKDAAGRKLAAAADKFVGEMTWGELLDEYGIKDKGKLGGARGKSGAGETTIDPEDLARVKRDEFSDWHARGRALCVEENIFQHLKPDEIRAAIEALEALTTDARAAVKPLLKKASA